jgi:hypothetical protein
MRNNNSPIELFLDIILLHSALAFVPCDLWGFFFMQSKPPRLTVVQILAWAAEHLQRTGKRPNGHSGPIPEAAGETWSAVHTALLYGYRGLPGGLSLAEFLNRHWGEKPPDARKPPKARNVPPLTIEQILAWAEAHYRRTGKWPTAASGKVPEALKETWKKINAALWEGYRGLPGGDSLSQLLLRHFGETSSSS